MSVAAISATPGLVGRLRVGLWRAGGWLLVGLALASIAELAPGEGGLMIVVLALPLLLGGFLVLRGLPLARTVGVLLPVLYGIGVAFVATTPLRGLTPAPGQSREPVDAATLVVAALLLLAAVLVAIGQPARTSRYSGPNEQ